MDLSLITARIVDQVQDLSIGSRVLGAAELEAAIANPELIIKPSAFVVWTGDAAIEQKEIPGQQPKFREEFAVVVAVDNSTDRRGAGGVATVQSLKDDLETALVGWAPDSSHLPIFYVGSTHVSMDASVLLHSLNYATVIPGGSIFTYTITVRVSLTTAIEPNTIFSYYNDQVIGVLGAGTRLTSDYLLDREVIPESATRFQLRMVPADIQDKADTSSELTEIFVELAVHHHLAPGDSERTYTEVTMAGKLLSLLSPSFWRNSAYTREILEPPTLSFGADLGRE